LRRVNGATSTEERDDAIAERRRGGGLIVDIADEFGLSRGRVARICQRELSEAERRALDGRKQRTAPRFTHVCEWCGGEFEMTEAEERTRPGKYCSNSCTNGATSTEERDDAIAERRRAGGLIVDIADEFGLSIGRVARICQRELSEAERRALDGRSRSKQRTAPRFTHVCEWCGGEFEMTEAEERTRPGKYCSNSCTRLAGKYGERGDQVAAGARAFHAEQQLALKREGLVPLTRAAWHLGFTTAAVRQQKGRAKLRLVRRQFGGVTRLAANAKDVLERSTRKQAAKAEFARALSALNGTVPGRPRKGKDAEIAELHAQGKSLGQIAAELGVSKTHVHRRMSGR
jgi:AraC-like DNA-binding protein